MGHKEVREEFHETNAERQQWFSDISFTLMFLGWWMMSWNRLTWFQLCMCAVWYPWNISENTKRAWVCGKGRNRCDLMLTALCCALMSVSTALVFIHPAAPSGAQRSSDIDSDKAEVLLFLPTINWPKTTDWVWFRLILPGNVVQSGLRFRISEPEGARKTCWILLWFWGSRSGAANRCYGNHPIICRLFFIHFYLL